MNKSKFIAVIVIALTSGLLVGVLAAKLHSRRAEVCNDVPCAYFNARLREIDTQIAQHKNEHVYLAIGDSITELADLPTICGRHPINAGIGGATSTTFVELGGRLSKLSKPDFVIIALGTNDAIHGLIDGFEDRMINLIKSLHPLPVLIVPLPPSRSVPSVGTFNVVISSLPEPKANSLIRVVNISDGIHLSATDYKQWTASISNTSMATVCAHL
jgi:lysophospholipase L1-like esterase